MNASVIPLERYRRLDRTRAREAVKGEIPPLGRALEPGICFIASFRQKAGPAFTPGLRLADEAFRADGAA